MFRTFTIEFVFWQLCSMRNGQILGMSSSEVRFSNIYDNHSMARLWLWLIVRTFICSWDAAVEHGTTFLNFATALYRFRGIRVVHIYTMECIERISINIYSTTFHSKLQIVFGLNIIMNAMYTRSDQALVIGFNDDKMDVD